MCPLSRWHRLPGSPSPHRHVPCVGPGVGGDDLPLNPLGLGLVSFSSCSQDVGKDELLQSQGEGGCTGSPGTVWGRRRAPPGGEHGPLWPVAGVCACGGTDSHCVYIHASRRPLLCCFPFDAPLPCRRPPARAALVTSEP